MTSAKNTAGNDIWVGPHVIEAPIKPIGPVVFSVLRDKMAMSVLPSVYESYVEFAELNGYEENWQIGVALDAYAMADAMMEARDVASKQD